MSLLLNIKKMFGKKESRRELFNTLYNEYRAEISAYHEALVILGRGFSNAIENSRSNGWVNDAEYAQLTQSIIITAANLKGAGDALKKDDLSTAMELSTLTHERIALLIDSITTTRDDMGWLLNNIKAVKELQLNVVESSKVLKNLMD